ncbi:MAG: methyltransferase domain-containing protein [Anaerolineales bacterium]
MSHSNAWGNPSKAGVAEALQMAAFLEERSRVPDAAVLNRRLCEMVAAKPGEHLLEVGTGSGILCRLLASSVWGAGVVVGLDISLEMCTQARGYSRAEGVSHGVAFHTAAAEFLPYRDNCFDGALAARTLLHVADPDTVVRELVRVVRPGGRIVTMDWDFETVTVDHPDRELTRRLLHWRNDRRGGNNWSGRQLWRHLKDAGLLNLTVEPCVIIAHTETEGLTQSLWRAAQGALDGGAISQAEHDGWVNRLKGCIEEGTFFASIVYFIVQGSVAGQREMAV